MASNNYMLCIASLMIIQSQSNNAPGYNTSVESFKFGTWNYLMIWTVLQCHTSEFQIYFVCIFMYLTKYEFCCTDILSIVDCVYTCTGYHTVCIVNSRLTDVLTDRTKGTCINTY